MKVEVLSNNYAQDALSKQLIKEFEKNLGDVDGDILYSFPIIQEMNEKLLIPNIFMIIPETGVFVIFCGDFQQENHRSYTEFCNEADRADAYIFSALMKQKNLQKNKRSLLFEIYTIKYLPFCKQHADDSTFSEVQDIIEFVKAQIGTAPYLDKERAGITLSNLEAATAMKKPKPRFLPEGDKKSKAYILNCIENQIARFDDKQRSAAMTLQEGPVRIRGLAGSGKTIILCLKAAYMHLLFPEKVIVYTFYTKSLYEYIKQLITRFYLKISDGQLPDFDEHVLILHAWGGRNVPGVYYQACLNYDIIPLIYSRVSKEKNPFDFVCRDFLDKSRNQTGTKYDYIIMDEAQDFPAAFYQLCRKIVKEDHLIWGYDELQNIFDVKIQNTKETFKNKDYPSGLDLQKYRKYEWNSNDIVIKKSYRNLREILIAAVSVGFGIYNERLVQSLENNMHWNDFGFDVLSGDCSREDEVEIYRPLENSPLSLPETMDADEIIEIYDAQNWDDEIEYVTQSIKKAIKEEFLRPDDIAVISLDDRYCSTYFKDLQEKLAEYNIGTYNLQDKGYVKGFSLEEYVTMSTVYKAKGNEAAMVFVIGCDCFQNRRNSRTMRNKIFTAFTRAKVWLRISGIGISNHSLVKEIRKLEENEFVLRFKNIPGYKLNRDWEETEKEEKKREQFLKELSFLIDNSGYSEKEVAQMIQECGEYGSEKHE